MILFLDASVLLAACGSERGASRRVFHLAPTQHWRLRASPHVVRETLTNLGKLGPSAASHWRTLSPALRIVEDVVSLDRPVVFPAAKDRPVLFTALAWSDFLLTLDRADFVQTLGPTFYGLHLLTPGEFLRGERAAGRLSI